VSDTAPEADRNLEPMGRTPRLVASSALIQALTGGWSASPVGTPQGAAAAFAAEK